jgi:predicted MPP superfamily phosphohydrolase/tetratricopeptide (TPR) repeat protein
MRDRPPRQAPVVRIAHPYALHSHFVGRERERRELCRWWRGSRSPIMLVDAIGGVGKSALAWVWLHVDVLRRDLAVHTPRIGGRLDAPETVFWWSFYGHNSKFRDYVVSHDEFLHGRSPRATRLDDRVDRLLRALADRRHLVVLDGLERILSAYERLSAMHDGDDVEEWAHQEPGRKRFSSLSDFRAVRFFQSLAATGARARVLCTSRLVPEEFRSADDADDLWAGIERRTLEGLDPQSALAFFRYYGVECHLGDVQLLCAPLKYHPLYLRLLAAYLNNLAPEERADVPRLARTFDANDAVARRRHLIDIGYAQLDSTAQRVVSTLAAFRSAVEPRTLQSVCGVGAAACRRALNAAERAGFILRDEKTKSCDMHPIVRAFAYERLTVPERQAVHRTAATHLAVLTAEQRNGALETVPLTHVLRKARDRTIADHFAGRLSDIGVPDATARRLAVVVELIWQLTRSDQHEQAVALYRDRLADVLFFKFGAYSEAVALLNDLRTGILDCDPAEQVWMLNALAMCYSRMGLMQEARPLYDEAMRIAREHEITLSLAIILQNLSEDLLWQGRLRECDAVLLESRAFGVREQHDGIVGLSYRLRGFVLNLTGQSGGEDELQTALRLLSDKHMPQAELYVHTNVAWGRILRGDSAHAFAELTLAEELSRPLGYQRDGVRIEYLKGKASRGIGAYEVASEHLRQALAQCRQIGLVEFEAQILTELARTIVATAPVEHVPGEVWTSLRDALRVARRSGLRIHEADVHVALAEASLRGRASFNEDVSDVHTRGPAWVTACEREVVAALACAECDGPPFRYQRVYDEARGIGAELKIARREPRVRRRDRVKARSRRRTGTPDVKREPIRILHISDLHLSPETSELQFSQLETDLRRELKVPALDYIVVSGDVANGARSTEYAAATQFLQKLRDRFTVASDHLLVVPGNHDVDWDAGDAAYDAVSAPTVAASDRVPDPVRYRSRFEAFARFYANIDPASVYALHYRDQVLVRDFPEHELLFVGFNSAWHCDRRFPARAEIHRDALAEVVDRLNEGHGDGHLRIAVWHHPVSGSEAMASAFVDLLTVCQVRLCLHGHVHETRKGFHEYDRKRGVHLVGAGTLGAPTDQLVPGKGWQYNLLLVNRDTRRITVETRKREDDMGSWCADARWGSKNAPKPRYTIAY